MAPGDFDGDGKLELLVSNSDLPFTDSFYTPNLAVLRQLDLPPAGLGFPVPSSPAAAAST